MSETAPAIHTIALCAQEGTLAAITKTLDRMERGQEKVVTLLEKVANQDAKIEGLQDGAEKTYKDVNELFTRVRVLEVTSATSGPEIKQHFHDTIDMLNDKLDKLNRFFSMATSKPAVVMGCVIIGMIAIGTFCDLAYHFESVKAIIEFIRG